MKKTRAYMSFGGGVQSTAIAMLAINKDKRLLEATNGILPELYIFADVGDEPRALYPHIEMMQRKIEASGAKFATVQTPLGSLGDHVIHASNNGFQRAEQLPYFVATEEVTPNLTGEHFHYVPPKHSPVKRHCTGFFKIKPLTQYARAYFGIYRGATPDKSNIQMWLGISCDEKRRLKAGRVPKQEWAEYANPLIDMNWHRADCINYLNSLGIAAKRSACVFCPFHDMHEWREVAKVEADWQRAIAVDEALEKAGGNGAFGFRNPLYLNRWGKRLRDLDLSIADDPQQKLFDNECAGVCGV